MIILKSTMIVSEFCLSLQYYDIKIAKSFGQRTLLGHSISVVFKEKLTQLD